MIGGQMGYNWYQKIIKLPLSKSYTLKTICVFLTLLVISFGACSQDRKEQTTGSIQKVTLGVPSSDYPIFLALVLLAKEQGFFTEQGLDIVYKFFPHGVASLNALQSGDVDIAIGAEFPFVKIFHEFK